MGRATTPSTGLCLSLKIVKQLARSMVEQIKSGRT